jgi:hypothetical protein
LARAKIPGPLERRHLVEKDLPPAQALAIAEVYLAQDRCVEAVDFLALAKDPGKVAELRERAIREGDAFLLRAVARAEDRAPTREEWQQLSQAAQTRGLERYAIEARRQAERGDE